jgi:hypothetical protein
MQGSGLALALWVLLTAGMSGVALAAAPQVFNVLDYGAVADNATDHGSCYRFGTGGRLLLPSNVKLVGVSNEKSFYGANGSTNGYPLGSALCITDDGGPFLTLGTNAGLYVSSTGVIGITFYYPNQTPGDPPGIAYRPTIQEQNNGTLIDFIIADCVFLNSYDGILMNSLPKARGTIRNVDGEFLHSAINIDNMQDWMSITNVFDSEQMWSINNNIIAFQKANATSLLLGAVPFNVVGYTATGKNALATLNTGAGGLVPQGHFKNINMDDCTNGIFVNATGYAGITIDGINLTCTGNGQGIYMGAGNVTISKLGSWGTFNNTINHAGGTLILDGAIFESSNTGYGLYNSGGDGMFNQIKFDAGFSAGNAALAILGGVDYFVTSMNVIPGGSSGTVQIATPGTGISNIVFTGNICRGPSAVPHSGSGVAFANNIGSC